MTSVFSKGAGCRREENVATELYCCPFRNSEIIQKNKAKERMRSRKDQRGEEEVIRRKVRMKERGAERESKQES